MKNYSRIHKLLNNQVAITEMIETQDNRITCFKELIEGRKFELYSGQRQNDLNKLRSMQAVKRRLEKSFTLTLNKLNRLCNDNE